MHLYVAVATPPPAVARATAAGESSACCTASGVSGSKFRAAQVTLVQEARVAVEEVMIYTHTLTCCAARCAAFFCLCTQPLPPLKYWAWAAQGGGRGGSIRLLLAAAAPPTHSRAAPWRVGVVHPAGTQRAAE